MGSSFWHDINKILIFVQLKSILFSSSIFEKIAVMGDLSKLLNEE